MAERIIKSNKIRIGDLSISYYTKRATRYPEKHIIFLHGFPFNKNMWREQLENLDEEVTGIAIDIRGHGNSTKGHGFFSIDVFAKDLGVFIEKLDLKRVILCGLSMGGYIALRAYQLFPENKWTDLIRHAQFSRRGCSETETLRRHSGRPAARSPSLRDWFYR